MRARSRIGGDRILMRITISDWRMRESASWIRRSRHTAPRSQKTSTKLARRALAALGIISRHTAGPTRTYMSPIAFHFTSALFVSLAALVPTHTRLTLGVLVGLNAIAGTMVRSPRCP